VRGGLLLLAAVQLTLELFAVAGMAATPLYARVAAGVGLLPVGWSWWQGWRRGRPLPCSEPAEWAVVGGVVLLAAEAGLPAPGLIFGMLYVHGLRGRLRIVLLRALTAVPIALVMTLVGPDSAGRDRTMLAVVPFFTFFLYLLNRVLHQHDRLVAREAALRAGAEALSGAALDRARLHTLAVETAFELVGRAAVSTVTLTVRSGSTSKIVAAAGADADEVVGLGVPVHDLPNGEREAFRRKPFRVSDSRPLTGAAAYDAREHVLVLPMRSGGCELGALVVASDRYIPDEIQASLVTWGTALAGSLESLVLHEELTRLAFSDPLTGLANRAVVEHRLAEALDACPAGCQVAYFLIDLNKFKPVNDEYGHQAGDELLRQVAARLRHIVRAGDVVARIGGDEFAAVLAGLSGQQEAIEIAGRIVAALADPFTIGPSVVSVSGSVGIAFASPRETTGPGELAKAADRAMYRAKAAGEGGWAVDDPALVP
jgi:diguanylate cyclase (GGDEF)-like protein